MNLRTMVFLFLQYFEIFQFPQIKWLTSPTCYTRCEKFLVSYPHRTSVNLLQDGYLKSKNLNMQILVHGESFPCDTFQALEYVDMEVEFD